MLILAGLATPNRLVPVYRAWMGLALLISKVTTPIFLGIVYFGVITPLGIARRLFGRNSLKRPSDMSSFWMERPPATETRSDMARLF